MQYSLFYLYIPSTWGTGLLTLKSAIDLSASIYGYCDSEQLYNKMAEVFSDEGLAQLATRSVVGAFFEMSDHLNVVIDSKINDFCRSYHAAKMFAIIFNFRIS